MNAATVEIAAGTVYLLPAAHCDGRLMAALAVDVHRCTGFENLGVPFDLTLEAELLGSEVDYGNAACEPRVVREAFPSAGAVIRDSVDSLLGHPRVRALTDAVRRLSAAHAHLPVIANIAGPISTAASAVDPLAFFKGMAREEHATHRVLDLVCEVLEEHARRLVAAGATVVCIGDPTATGEILGPHRFAEFALPRLSRLVAAVRSAGAPVIVHICGDITAVRHLLPEMRADALSTDAKVSLGALKREFPGIRTVGNVSTQLLEFGPPERVARQVQRLLAEGVDVVAPACGLSASTPLTHIRALTDAVKLGRPLYRNERC